jgi:tetratricopeptide (TPR) repeat protein
VQEPEGHEPSAAVLARFATEDATAEERAAVLAHLLAGCPVCRRALRLGGWHSPARELELSGADGALAAPPAGAYDAAFAAAAGAAHREFARQQLQAQPLLAEVDRLPHEEQELRVRNVRRYASPALSAAYVERSHAVRFSDHAELVRFARLAVAAAEAAAALPPKGKRALEDCRARAWAQLGNAHRIRAEIPEAGKAFAKARRYLAQGTGDPELRALVLHQLASLYRYQRDFSAAVAALEQAIAAYRACRDRSGEGGALVNLAIVHLYAGSPRSAIAPLERAIALLTPRPLDLLRTAVHSFIVCHLELGNPYLAHGLMAESEPHFRRCTDELVLVHRTWLQGKIDRELGLYLAAEARLLRVRDTFLDKDLPFEVAVVSLDLAEVFTLQRRVPEVVRTVGETIPVFQGLGVTRDLLAALLRLRELAHDQAAARALLRTVIGELEAARPQLAG